MKVFLLLVIFAIAEGMPNPQATSKIIYEYKTMYIGGGYKYAFESDDGTKKEETGEVVNEGRDDQFIKVTGSYSYIGDDGETYTVLYTADQNGFHPSSPIASSSIEPSTQAPAAPGLLYSLIGNGIRR